MFFETLLGKLYEEKIHDILVCKGLPNYIQITPEEISEHLPSLLKTLNQKHDYCFFGGQGYIPILKGNLIKKSFTLSKKKNKLNFITFPVSHGWIKSTAYIFNKTAYISDCNGIKNKDLKKLMDLNLLIVDCLKINQHPSHFNLNQAINLSKKINSSTIDRFHIVGRFVKDTFKKVQGKVKER